MACSRRRVCALALGLDARAAAPGRHVRQRRDVCAAASRARRGGERRSGDAAPPFTPPTDPGPGGILFAASGEVLALTGYAVPAGERRTIRPSSTAGTSTSRASSSRSTTSALSNGPNVKPGDQSCTEPTVAKVAGPWAVDLRTAIRATCRARAAPARRPCPSRPSSHQNYPAGNAAAFDTSGTTRTRSASTSSPRRTSAMNVNIDAAGLGRLPDDDRRRLRRPLRRHGDVQGDRLHVPDRRPTRPRPATRRRTPAGRPWAIGALPPLLQVADHLRQLPEPRQRSGHAAGRRGARARHLLQEATVGRRAGHDPHRPPVLGQRAPRLARALRSVRGARRGPGAKRRVPDGDARD